MERITRREFLKFGVGFALSTLLPRRVFPIEPIEKEKSIIAVAKGDRQKLVKSAIELLGGIRNFIKPNERVLIKPNISFASNNKEGSTTSPEIIKQVVELCLEAGASKIIIADHPLANSEICIKKSGIREAIIDKNRVKILMLTQKNQFYDVEIISGKELKKVSIAKVLQKTDKLINLPTAKSHSATGVSLGLKNLMGLVWDRGMFHRVNLHQAIAELATIIRPHLTIIDATRILTSGGPGGPGRTLILNTVIASSDIVAVDSYTVEIGEWYNKRFKGKDVKHIRAAYEVKLGEIDIEKILVKRVEV